MTASLAHLLGPLVNVVAIVITGSSAYFLWSRRTSKYNQVRSLVGLVYLISLGLISLEFFRIAEPSSFIPTYTILQVVLSLSMSAILVVAATAIFLDAPDSSLRDMLAAIAASKRHLAAIAAYVSYTLVIFSVLIILRPFSTASVTDLWGAASAIALYSTYFIALLLPELFVFMFYGTYLVSRAAARTSEADLRRSLLAVAASWGAVAVIYVVSSSFAYLISIDTTSLMYLAFSITFAFSALSFNRASALAALLLKRGGSLAPVSAGVSGTTGVPNDFLNGRKFLVEFDPALPYEKAVVNAATNARDQGSEVFVFTSRSSSVYSGLARVPGMKFFILSGNVTYVRPSDRPGEVFLPQDNTSILLDTLEKSVSTNGGQRTTVVFDSITDMVVMLGLDETYRFLRRVNEVLSDSGAGGMFLFTPGAHDERVDSIIRSLFPNHLVIGSEGPKVTKAELAVKSAV